MKTPIRRMMSLLPALQDGDNDHDSDINIDNNDEDKHSDSHTDDDLMAIKMSKGIGSRNLY